jgi:8-oxo-dGTP diphosphatase
MTEYVLGFLFSPDLSRVVLIRKERPTWQAGKLNGVGGKVDPGEDAHTAMVREFREETGVQIPEWYQFATIGGPDAAHDHISDFKLSVFYAISVFYDIVTSMTDERVTIYRVEHLMDADAVTVPNVRWLLQMALSLTRGEGAKSFAIAETY